MILNIENNSHRVIIDDFTDENIEIIVGENSSLILYTTGKVGEQGRTTKRNFNISLKRNSIFKHFNILMNTPDISTRIHLIFEAEGAECELNGCVVADGKHRIENHTLIEHRAGHCTSNELYKYVLSDEAVGVFEGRVLVHPNAQKTVSHETNQNLCTTKECRMFTKPELEIYADDVKCSHGSSVGQLNDAALFYMQQRGIPLAQGRKLLQDAFIAEVLEKIPNFHVPLPTE